MNHGRPRCHISSAGRWLSREQVQSHRGTDLTKSSRVLGPSCNVKGSYWPVAWESDSNECCGCQSGLPGSALCLVTDLHYSALSRLEDVWESCAVARAVMLIPQTEVRLRLVKGLCQVEDIDSKSVLLLPDLLNSIVYDKTMIKTIISQWLEFNSINL